MLSYAELARVVADLAPLVAGKKLQKINQPESGAMVFELYGDFAGQTGKRWLYLSADPDYGRLHFIDEPPENPAAPPALCAYLRAHLTNPVVESIACVGNDRIVEIRLSTSDGARTLMLELLGQSANLYVLDAARKVTLWLRPPARGRGMLRNMPWTPPAASSVNNAAVSGAVAGVDRFTGLSGADLHGAIHGAYARRQTGDELSDLRKRITSALLKERRYMERTKKSVEQDLEESKRYPEFKKFADLLKGYLSSVEAGKESVALNDHDADGKVVQVTIPLDPQKTPVQNMEWYYARYHKGLIGSHKLSRHQVMLLGAADDNAKIGRDLAATQDDGLKAFAERIDVRRLLDKYSDEKPKGDAESTTRVGAAAVTEGRVHGPLAQTPAALRPRRFISSDGWDILVGRNAVANDYLTMRVAAGHDWFFHLADAPGSHVILRAQRGKSPPLESLLDCAQLALHFSTRREATSAQVRYVERKHVQKPKGAKPGLVFLTGGKTLDVRKDDERIARLLAKR